MTRLLTSAPSCIALSSCIRTESGDLGSSCSVVHLPHLSSGSKSDTYGALEATS